MANRAAKERAIRATIDYYRTMVPEFRGALYFGYNLYKEEGTPPAIMDWTLVYPDEPAGSTTAPAGGATTAAGNKPTAASSVTTEKQNGGAVQTDPDSDKGSMSGSMPSGSSTVTAAAESKPANRAGSKTGMPTAIKIWLGILGGAFAVLGGLVAVWLWMNRKKQPV
ncbi:hypothetical protein SDC9_203361 [bioreactor metagenome]|uniref:Uncharacterized protein n=1 Tax=bioreactor metagenome TaxID=1076179 RepID=A0A645IX07_9ZZZZ